MAHDVGYLSSEILQIYHDIDTQTSEVANLTGLQCPPQCGKCCHSPKIVASVLEVIPMALDIYLTSDENTIMDKIETQGDNPTCVMFDADPEDANKGRCSRYQVRPLICRLFGYSARKNKHEELEFAGCRVHKEQNQAAYVRATTALQNGISMPISQEWFMQIAATDPQLGYRILPINQALAEALEYLYFKRPRQIPRTRKRAS